MSYDPGVAPFPIEAGRRDSPANVLRTKLYTVTIVNEFDAKRIKDALTPLERRTFVETMANNDILKQKLVKKGAMKQEGDVRTAKDIVRKYLDSNVEEVDDFFDATMLAHATEEKIRSDVVNSKSISFDDDSSFCASCSC